jgi:hypothetical protein
MVEHKCEKCGHVFHHKGTYNNHQKTNCVDKPRTFRNKEFKCSQCDMIFYRSDKYKEHLKMHERKNAKIDIKVQNNFANNEIVNNVSIGSVNSYVNNGPVINIVQKNYVVGHLYPYHKQMDFFNFSSEEIHKILNSGKNPFIVMFELIHCNDNRPLYNNIVYIDKDKLFVYNGEEWIKKNHDDVTAIIMNGEENSLVDYFFIMKKFLDEKSFKSIHDTIESVQIRKNGSKKEWDKTIILRNEAMNGMIYLLKEHNNIKSENDIIKKYSSIEFDNNNKSSFRNKSVEIAKRTLKENGKPKLDESTEYDDTEEDVSDSSSSVKKIKNTKKQSSSKDKKKRSELSSDSSDSNNKKQSSSKINKKQTESSSDSSDSNNKEKQSLSKNKKKRSKSSSDSSESNNKKKRSSSKSKKNRSESSSDSSDSDKKKLQSISNTKTKIKK